MENSPIISDLQLMLENHRPVELLNIYKGVPFVSTGRILEIGADRAQIEVDAVDLVCMHKEGFTCLLGNDYFEPASAQVETIDLSTSVVTLTHFTPLGARLGVRMALRVEPAEPVPVLVHTQDRPLLGSMIDLSMNGIGIYIPGDRLHTQIRAGGRVFVTTTLPGGEIALHGTLLNMTTREGGYRLSIRFTLDHNFKVILYHYLVDRRNEIEAEVHSEFRRLRSDPEQGQDQNI